MEVHNFLDDASLRKQDRLFDPFLGILKEYPPHDVLYKRGKEELIKEYNLDPKISLSHKDRAAMNREVDKGLDLIQRDFPNLQVPLYIFGMNKSNSFVIKEMGGSSGYAFPDAAIVYFHPESDWKKHLCHSIIHELNHMARYSHGDPYFSFLNWVILEGLAETYVTEKFPEAPLAPWVQAASAKQLKELRPKIEKFWTSDDFPPDAHEWFFGNPDKGIPQWLGYSLGFDIVKKHRETQKQVPWAEYIETPSEIFIGC